MKNTITKPKLYLKIAIGSTIISFIAILVFIIQAVIIEWENVFVALFFLPILFISIYRIVVFLKWKIVFKKQTITVYKPFCTPKEYDINKVFKRQPLKGFFWEFESLWYQGKKIISTSIYDVNCHLLSNIQYDSLNCKKSQT